MGPTDAELIRAWQAGDAGAFEALVRRWQQPIARFLSRLGLDHALVLDLSQEVFLRVYRSAPNYREAGSFSAWIHRIALNLARDAARRDRGDVPLDDDLPGGDEPGPASCDRRELREIVAKAVADLPEPLRVCLVLRHYQGLSFEAMSELLQTPASTLKSRFAAALERLRFRLACLDPDPQETSE